MRKVTPRIQIVENLEECVGLETLTNLSPTMRAKLTHFDKEKSYFVSVKSEWSQLDNYVGDIFYMPTQMAMCLKFE